MNKIRIQWLLLTGSVVLLVTGGTLLLQQIRPQFFKTQSAPSSPPLAIESSKGRVSDLQGFYPVESVVKYTVRQDGKDAFSFLLAHYKDQQQEHRAVLFNEQDQNSINPSPIALRQAIWQEAAKTIKDHAPENSLFLSWWDDSQRIHFLSGRHPWISKPGQETLLHPLWQGLKNDLLTANAEEQTALTKMARWLTMDSQQALSEIRQFFGTSRPIYLLLTNDLLSRTSELVSYSGSPLQLNSTAMPSHDNLHSDISQIRQWANEIGNGNYLVQKEGNHYRAWVIPKSVEAIQSSLLIRLLPFVNSLKQLPEGINLVYQSHWGGYLSIYKIN